LYSVEAQLHTLYTVRTFCGKFPAQAGLGRPSTGMNTHSPLFSTITSRFMPLAFVSFSVTTVHVVSGLPLDVLVLLQSQYIFELSSISNPNSADALF